MNRLNMIMSRSILSIFIILLVSITHTKCMPSIVGGKILIPVSFGAYAYMDYPLIAIWSGSVYGPYRKSFYYDKYNKWHDFYYHSDYDSQSLVPSQYSSLSSSLPYNHYEDKYNNEVLGDELRIGDSYYYDKNENNIISHVDQKYDQSYKNDDYQPSVHDDIQKTSRDHSTIDENKSNYMHHKYKHKKSEVENSHYKNHLHRESMHKHKPNVYKPKKFEYNDQHKVSKSADMIDKHRKYHNDQQVDYDSKESNNHHHHHHVHDHRTRSSNNDNEDEITQLKYYYDRFIDGLNRPNYIDKYHNYKNPRHIHKYPKNDDIHKKSNDVYETRESKHFHEKHPEEMNDKQYEKKPKPSDTDNNDIRRRDHHYNEEINRKKLKHEIPRSKGENEKYQEPVEKETDEYDQSRVSVIKVINEYT
ncbi:unnamed protein product [Schistosoma turkestanicum]|nr:unnamed protein product [Schistosoma turkestanicum]